MKIKILLITLLFCSLCFSCKKTIEKPTVTTINIKDITQRSAVCRGNVSSDGGSEVTSRGICYSITENPTITEGSRIDCGSGTGDFECKISKLSINCTYYVRAFAINSEGVSYGEQLSFETKDPTLPVLEINEVINITDKSALAKGCIISDGGLYILVRGFVCSQTPNPTVDKETWHWGSIGSYDYEYELKNLKANTTYYIRAYASNDLGTAYSEQLSFTTKPYTEVPTVSTSSIINVSTNGAICGGNITKKGTSEIIARGVCWSTHKNPTIEDPHTCDGSGTGSFTSTIDNLEEYTCYYVRAYATNSEGTGYGMTSCLITHGGSDGDINGHGYIDLGLPSGLKWAIYNIGAATFEEHGESYAWGKIETDIVDSVMYGIETSDFSGDPRYDAARAKWGSTWRMPTKQEFEELISHCEWDWQWVNGCYLAKITGPNGKSIYLPSQSYYDGMWYDSDLWSSTPHNNNKDAYSLFYDTPLPSQGIVIGGYPFIDPDNRLGKKEIRAVSE